MTSKSNEINRIHDRMKIELIDIARIWAMIINYLKIDYKPTKLFHLIVGTIFYILGALVAQQESLKNIWF